MPADLEAAWLRWPGAGWSTQQTREAFNAGWRMARERCVYRDHDLSSGLGWDGHIVCGDRKSIDAVKRAVDGHIFERQRADALLTRLRAAEARLASIKELVS